MRYKLEATTQSRAINNPETLRKLELEKLLEAISGKDVETELIKLAQIGGSEIEPSEELPQRYSVNRLALAENELKVKQYLADQMTALGLVLEDHPLGLIATFEGSQPELPAVGIVSHYDSVPNAGMYDGTTGIVAGISIIKSMIENGIQPKRSIKLIAFTGEESARFNMALFGSKGIFQGLSENELLLKDENNVSMQQAIEKLGYNPELVTKPFFKPEDFESIIELHVAQDSRFPDKLAIIESIAAPERYKVEIRNEDTETVPLSENSQIISVTVEGKTGHSGATPMGPNFRTDGLVLTTELLNKLLEIDDTLLVGNIKIDGQAMNKIPGSVSFEICLPDVSDKKRLEKVLDLLSKETHTSFSLLTDTTTTFSQRETNQLSIDTLNQITAIVHKTANKYKESDTVGTVSTIQYEEGKIILGIDLRGIDQESRSKMTSEIKEKIQTTVEKDQALTVVISEPLPGSGLPEPMNPKLVTLTQNLANQLNIAPYTTTFSPAGHDIQNISRPGIPTVMIHCPSRNNGISHTPEEYSNPQDLEWGTRLTAAVVYTISQNID